MKELVNKINMNTFTHLLSFSIHVRPFVTKKLGDLGKRQRGVAALDLLPPINGEYDIPEIAFA